MEESPTTRGFMSSRNKKQAQSTANEKTLEMLEKILPSKEPPLVDNHIFDEESGALINLNTISFKLLIPYPGSPVQGTVVNIKRINPRDPYSCCYQDEEGNAYEPSEIEDYSHIWICNNIRHTKVLSSFLSSRGKFKSEAPKHQFLTDNDYEIYKKYTSVGLKGERTYIVDDDPIINNGNPVLEESLINTSFENNAKSYINHIEKIEESLRANNRIQNPTVTGTTFPFLVSELTILDSTPNEQKETTSDNHADENFFESEEAAFEANQYEQQQQYEQRQYELEQEHRERAHNEGSDKF